jgi:hypothetical protein
MAGTTSAFGWDYPTSTDLVKDGATAIQTLATDIDTSLKRHGCVIYRNSDFTVTSGVSAKVIPMNLEALDTDGFHSTVTNTSRVTIPAGLAGVYCCVGYLRWEGTTVAQPLGLILKNGFAVVRTTGPTAAYVSNNPSWVGYLAVGDYVEFAAYQESGVNKNVSYTTATNLDPLGPTFSVFRVGGPA